MVNINRIITSKDYSVDEGADGTHRGRILKRQQDKHRKGITVQVKGLDNPRGRAVLAEINQGAWIAQCECGGAEFVDPDDAIFFCWSCANRENGFFVRPVTFPANVKEIEDAILEREVKDIRGLTEKDRAYLATPLISFVDEDGTERHATRSWIPGETVEDLKRQNDFIKDLKEENPKQKDEEAG